MKKTFLLSKIVFLLIVFPFFSQAQTAKVAEMKIQTDSIHQKIDIDFTTSNVIYNLLVHLNDSTGQTIYLDNQYLFSGHYKKSIDLKKQGKGTYFLEVIKDNEHLNKKIVLK